MNSKLKVLSTFGGLLCVAASVVAVAMYTVSTNPIWQFAYAWN